MTVDCIKEKVDEIISDTACVLQLYFVLRQEGEYVLKIADIDDVSTMPELMKLFKNSLSAALIENEGLTVRSLSKDDETGSTLYEYDYEEYPEELSLIHQFQIKSAVRSDKFSFESDSLGKLFGYIVYLGTMDKGISLFKKHYPIALIKRDSFLLGAKKSKHRFEKISGEDILRLNPSWQLANLDGTLFVSDLSVLERNLGFTRIIERNARATISAIDELNIVGNIEALSDELSNLTFARKLSRIRKSSAVFSKNIPPERIIEFSKNKPALAGYFKYSESGKHIILSTKRQKDEFLRLLNDDFLLSELTEEYYSANSKDVINI